ncbi:MAG: restriction endonuclease subunit S [Lactococcus lactis]|jgi:restriction endonuclease S subunit|nr:restriction endonuclease subunit S [Lactococcus lactis]
MSELQDKVNLTSGSPQFRFVETADLTAPLYNYYGQVELSDDLVGMDTQDKEAKQIRLFEKVILARTGDVVFSLISGKASVVSKNHDGYLLTQNYVKLTPDDDIDARFLVYLLNEDKSIIKQFKMSMQGSMVLKYTVKQLRKIILPVIPEIDKQSIIGEIYFNQLRLTALKNRTAMTESTIVLEKLKEANSYE